MASPAAWVDFETHRDSIRFNTVAKLQAIISGWTDQCRISIPKSGRKQDLIDRMIRVMTDWRENNQSDKWLRAKAVLEQVRETGLYSQSAMPGDLSNVYHSNQVYGSPAVPPKYPKYANPVHYPLPSSAAPSHLRYDAYAPPRKAVPSASVSLSSSAKPSIRFKSSPFYKVEQMVSTVVECPESTSPMDRRSQNLTFALTPEQLSKLQTDKYQLRLFCTSSMYHSHHQTGFRTEGPCPIEFPATCEVRVNNSQLTANLKGLKKKPGTAPPPDLGKTVRLAPGLPNRVDMVYVNSQQPIQHKKFYMVVYLVEATNVEQLVEKLKKGKYKDESEIRGQMSQTASYDDDIIAGPQKMSLKCPLSYLRVETPCRSVQCRHAQCFDATSWFSMMEQTTTWLCPVCDKVLNVEELIIDGYFDRILKETPESVEDVMVEADGEWHTSDNKYASDGWRATHPIPNSTQSKSGSPSKEPEKLPSLPSSLSGLLNHDPPRQEVISLDSDSDDEGLVKRELSPGAGYPSSSQSQSQAPPQSQSQSQMQARSYSSTQTSLPPSGASSRDVIDLTLDSDEDEPPPPPPPPRTSKRRADTEADVSMMWKRARYAGPRPPSVSGTSGGYTNGVGGSHSQTDMNGQTYPPGIPGPGGGSFTVGGAVRIPTTPPTYQVPYSHSPPTYGMPPPPPHRPNVNSFFSPPGSRPIDLGLPTPPTFHSNSSGNYPHRGS